MKISSDHIWFMMKVDDTTLILTVADVRREICSECREESQGNKLQRVLESWLLFSCFDFQVWS